MPRHPWLRRAAIGLGLLMFLAIGAKAMISLSGVLRLTPLAVTVTPAVSLPAEEQTLESQTVGLAFDRDTTTAYTAYGNSQVKVTFETAEEIHRLRIFGSSPFSLSVSSVDAQGNVKSISSWNNIDLSGLSSGWNSLDLGTPVAAQVLVLSISPKGGTGAGIPEIEFWGKGIAQNAKSGSTWESLWNNTTPSSPSTMLMSGREYASLDTAVSIGGLGGPAAANFRINLPLDGKSYRRAWLMYDVQGQANWIAVPRTINGQESAGGWPLPGSSSWSTQTEPIHPGWLTSGENKVTFGMPLGVITPYQVKNVRIVVEQDNGANLIDEADASSGEASVLLDGDETTGWRPYVDGGQNPSLTLSLYRTVSVDGIQLYLDKAISGKVVVGVLQNGTWTSLGDAVNNNGLSAGWQQVQVRAQGAVDAISLTFAGGSGSGSIMEAMAQGSGVGKPYGPTVEVSYPDAGQYFGREAYIRGFLGQSDNGSGPAQVMLGPKQVNVTNGQFEGIVAKEDVGLAGTPEGDAWAVTVTAIYPDGSQLQKVIQLNQDQAADSGVQSFGTYAQKVLPGNTVIIDKMGARLEMLKDALKKKIDLKVVGLYTTDLPPMNPGMTNVTGGKYRGFRFLPHGTQFASKVKMTLPYDESLLPAGKKAKDVRTYYFDTNRGMWMPLELSSTDKVNGKIVSLTKHFTDFVNATITTPSNPQEVNFNPNQIKDIKAADPGAQINLIEPPQANNNGTANLSYPIEVPAGRKGVQPQLSVAYNSGGGDGLMGVGWDMNIQSITVETRWGVPRYWDGNNSTPNVESETYLLNGEMLTEDLGATNHSYLAHRSSLSPSMPFYGPRLSGAVTFRTRTEGKFDLIIRHGSDATNYWWEVTDKSGMKTYFGGSADGTQPDNGAILRDGNGPNGGHIFLWAMREMKDPHGNSMQYGYDIVTTGTGSEIYANNITYTGTNGTPGPYKVQFFHGQGNYLIGNATAPVLQSRPDVPLNAKGGFPRATGDVLDHVIVYLNNNEIRRYNFTYTLGAFSKTLLKKIDQLGPNGEVFAGNTHVFSYYNDVQGDPVGSPNTYTGFKQISATGPGSTGDNDGDVVAGSLGALDGNPTALGGTESSEVGGHFYIGFAPGFGFTKGDSLGFKVGYSQSNGDGKLQFIDVDGDGLPDLVFRQGGGQGPLMYYKNLGQPGPNGTLTFDASPRSITGINTISSDNSSMFSGGFEIYIGGVNGMINFSGGTNVQSTFFTDVNGDGVPDLVQGSSVAFGHVVLDPQGVPTQVIFQGNSGGTANPLCAGSAVQSTNFMPDFTNQFTQAATQDPLVDVLKQWTAPYDGVVTIHAPVTLVANAAMAMPPQDGVRVRVEMAPVQSVFPSTGQNNTLTMTNNTVASVLVQTPGAAGAKNIDIAPVTVHMGDRIYFREQSIFDGKYDVVNWDPQINYTKFGNTINGFIPATPPLPDPNKLDATSYDATKDFTLAGRRGIAVNLTNSGNVTLSGDITLNAGLSDAVSLLVIENRVFNDGTPSQSATLYDVPIPPSTLASTFPQTIPLNGGNIIANPPPFATTNVGSTGVTFSGLVNNTSNGQHEEDQLQLVFVTDSNINVKAIQWSPVIGYISYVPSGQTTAITPTSPIIVQAPFDILYYPDNNLTEPQMPFPLSVPFSPVNPPLKWIITPNLLLNHNETFTGNIVLTVKQNGVLVGKRIYSPPSTALLTLPTQVALGLPLTITTDSNGNPINSTESFYVNLTFANQADATQIDAATDVDLDSKYIDAVNTTPQPSVAPFQEVSEFSLDAPGPDTDVLPAAYRGWSYVAFQANPPGTITNSTNGASPDTAFVESQVLTLPSAAGVNVPSSLQNGATSNQPLNPNDPSVQNFQNQMQTLQGQTKVVVLHPDPISGNWAGPTTEIFAGPAGMESSRLLVDQVQLPVDPTQLGGSPSSGGGANGCGAGAVGAMKISNNTQTTFGVGGGFSGFSANGSIGTGTSTSVLDYMDVNGDGYPDILTTNGTQYTLPVGGMETSPRGTVTLNRVNSNSVSNIGAGGNSAAIESSGTSKTKGSGSQMPPVGIGFNGSIGGSDSDQQSDLVDMNGDGLPDKVSLDSNHHLFVQLNTGYGFAAAQDWTPSNGSAHINKSSTANGGLGLGFNDNVYGFAGGVNGSTSDSKTTVMLTDVNGDGLPDVVTANNGNYQVYVNTGSGFAPTAITWNGSANGFINRNVSETGGGGLYISIPIPIPFVGSIILNPGADANFTTSAPHGMLTDANGDGYPDVVLSDSPTDFRVYENQWGRTNLLKEVDRPLGAKIMLDYTGSQNTYANPHHRWDLVNVVVYDGGQNGNATATPKGADFQQTTYDYTGGFYDRFERDFLGYAAVTETQRDTTGKTTAYFSVDPLPVSAPLYRRVTKQYLNANFYEKGLESRENTDDVSGATPLPFLETDNNYILFDVFANGSVPLNDNSLSVPSNTVFPQLVQTVNKHFEGGTGEMDETQAFVYDTLGNVINFTDSGDASELNSAVAVTIGYSSTDANLASSYIVGLPETMSVFDNSSNILRHRAAAYSPQGDLTRVNQFLADGTSAQTDIFYDSFGMPTSQMGPINSNGLRPTLLYQWDSVVHNYPVSIIDGLGYATAFNYDFRFGKPVTETDENKNQIQTVFDDFGREVTVVGPFEASSTNNFHNHWTIVFDYHPEVYSTGGVPYAHTQHFDPYRDQNDPIDTILFTDGLKRIIQTKKDDTVFQAGNRAPLDVMTISGRLVYDQMGRTIGQYYPMTEATAVTKTLTNFTFNSQYDSVTPTIMTYDVMDRNLITVIPDGTSTVNTYAISTDNVASQLRNTVNDADSNIKKTYKDVRGLIRQVNEYNGPSTIITTTYTYDPIKQITQVADANGNLTTITYDNLGRRTSINNPDAGNTLMVYDLASNMTKKITQNLANEGGNRAIQYRYDADNRLTNISYPDFPQNNVIYTYGTPVQTGDANGNLANRIASVMDASGYVQRLYDVQGNVTREVKVLASPTEVNEPFQLVSGGVTTGVSSGCSTCVSSPLSGCATCSFGIWTTSPSLSGTDNSWGRLGVSTGSCSTCSQGQFVGWGTANDHPLESAALPITFVTQYTYDTWGRIQAMTYPDGEVLTYQYDSGGLPRSATGMIPNKSQVFPYVLRLEYDKFEQRAFVQNGNGTQSSYTYDANTRRLAQLQSFTGPNQFQNLTYTYDSVGNITRLANQIQPLTPGYLLGGPVTQNFGYDGLYRLTHADGKIHSIFDPSCGSTYDSNYTLDMTYDNIHNIVEKKQTANFTQVNNSNNLTVMGPDTRLTYDWQYSYNGPHPHAPTQIGSREFFYDDNGNSLGYDVLPGDCCSGANRNMIWDEENRLYAVGDDDPGVRATDFGDVHFVYNDQGQRVYKIQGGNITAYINQFYVVDKPQGVDGFVGSKHIFIGSDRIASQIVNPKDDQTLAIDASLNPCPNCANSGCATCGSNSGSVSVVQSSSMGWGRNVQWANFSQNIDSQGQLNGTNDQIQYVTALNDGTPIYGTDSVEGSIVGHIDSCETMTLMTLNPYTDFYEVQYNGQPAYVQDSAVTVGTPSSCKGVWPNSSVLPDNYFVFFYHPDHTGSTGYMSDGNGVLAEHIEYIPFGESWIEQRQGLGLFPSYQFTSKEWDPETGLYYFGARYYDPRTSVWQSVDPALMNYLKVEDSAGIYTSKNLSLYSYAFYNPIRLKDPDGKTVGDTLVGFGEGAWQSVTTLATVVAHPINTVTNFAAAVAHPVRTWNALTTALSNGSHTALYGSDHDSGKVWGNLTGNVILAIGTGGAVEAASAKYASELESLDIAANAGKTDEFSTPLLGENNPASNEVVLGHYGESEGGAYINIAKARGSSYFNIEDTTGMSREEITQANMDFLDKGIALNKDFKLGTQLRPGPSAFRNELLHMQENGYTISEDGTALIPPPPGQ